jgi:ABC-type microcin C transport system duplicated ATPase subunit YejF
MTEPVLVIKDLTVALPSWSDRPFAVENVSLEIAANEILCVVGESGSGKSVMAKAILRLLPAPHVRVTGGRIDFQGQDLLALEEDAMRAVRGARIAMIFQEPMVALNPLMTVGRQIDEVFEVHTDLDAAARRKRTLELFADVHLPEPERLIGSYPHELSGGQRQRVMIAMALALEPALIIADEPTTALDVTTQAQILALIKELQKKHNTAVLFITHDFGVVSEIADRVVVMRHGRLVETGRTADVLGYPRENYTKALVAAVPSLVPRHHAPVDPVAPVLIVRNLSKTYGGRAGQVPRRQGGRKCEPRSGQGQLAGPRRRVGFRQVDLGALHHWVGDAGTRRDTAQWTEHRGALSCRNATAAPAYPDGVPGPVRLAQSTAEDRRHHCPRAHHPRCLARCRKARSAQSAASRRPEAGSRRPLPA